jgi:hypothetical protein
MAENIEKLILDDSGFINPLKESIKVMEEAEKAFKDLNNAQAQGGQKVAQEVKKNSEMQGKAIEDVKKKQQELRKETIESAKDQKFFGVSLNDVTGKLNDIKAKLKGYVSVVTSSVAVTKTQQEGIQILTTGLGGGAKAWKAMAIGVNIFKAALIATGIGALIVALGGLVSFLTSTQKGMDLVSQKTAFLGGAFDVAKGKISAVGNAIVESFSNGTVIQDFGNLLQEQITNRVTGIIDVFKNLWSVVSGGGKSLSDVAGSLGQVVTGIDAQKIKDTAKEMYEAAQAAEAIQKQLTALKREQAAYNVQFATTRAQIEQLKKIGDDTSKTFGERTNAIKKAGALEQSINAKNLDFISREIDLTQKRINLKGTENITDEDRQKVYDLQLKKAELINDTAGKSTEIQNTLNGLLKEQKDLLSGISESLIKIGREYNLVTEKEEFEFVKAKQIEQLELFIKQLKDVGKTLGKDVTGQIKIAQQAIDGLNSRDFTSTFKPISQLARDLRPASQEIKILEKRLKDLQDININFGVDNTVTQEKIKKQIEKLTKGGLKSENVLKIQFPDIKIIGSEDVKFYDDFLNGIEDFEGLLQKTLDEIFGDVDGEKAKEFLKGAATVESVSSAIILNEATDIQLS